MVMLKGAQAKNQQHSADKEGSDRTERLRQLSLTDYSLNPTNTIKGLDNSRNAATPTSRAPKTKAAQAANSKVFHRSQKEVLWGGR